MHAHSANIPCRPWSYGQRPGRAYPTGSRQHVQRCCPRAPSACRFSHERLQDLSVHYSRLAQLLLRCYNSTAAASFLCALARRGQVAQLVERSPEKAGVGGSTPSLATIISKDLAAQSRNFQPTVQPTIRRLDPIFLTAPSPSTGESCRPT